MIGRPGNEPTSRRMPRVTVATAPAAASLLAAGSAGAATWETGTAHPRKVLRALSVATVLLLAAGCGTQTTESDAGPSVDAESRADSGDDSDAGSADAGAPADAGRDSGGPDGRLSIVSPESPVVASGGDILIRVFVEGAAPELIALRLDGEPLATIPPPYEHSLHLDSLDEGEHEVVASTDIDGVSVESEPLVIRLDRTGPSVTSVDPPTSGVYRMGDPVTVTFDEPVDPGSVSSSSVSLATSGGEVLTSSLEFDSEGSVLTITPTGPAVVADGAVELSLGVTDPAGNPGMPFDASWSAPRWLPTGAPSFPRSAGEGFADRHLELEVTSTGELFVAGLLSDGTGGHHVRVARFDGSSWSAVGGPACAGTGVFPTAVDLAALGSWDLELEPDDTPVVAVRDLSTFSSPAVRFCRWDGTSWQEEPAPASIPDLRELDLAISSAGDRALVAGLYVDGVFANRTAQTWRRSSGGAWSTVGSPTGGHDERFLTQLEFDRADRITQLRVRGGSGAHVRDLYYFDAGLGRFVFETGDSAGYRARLLETSSSRAMLTQCAILESESTSPVFELPFSGCDAAASPATERRLIVYEDGFELGLALETSAGSFEDLGSADIHATDSGDVCTTPDLACRFLPRGFFVSILPSGRVIVVAKDYEEVMSFELHALGTLP